VRTPFHPNENNKINTISFSFLSYPDYKFMPRKKLPDDLRLLLSPSTKEYTSDNPPRKMARRSLPPLSDRVEPVKVTRIKRKYKRSAVKKPPQIQESTRGKQSSKKTVKKWTSLESFPMDDTEPVYAKFIRATIRGGAISPITEDTKPQDPDGSLTHMDEWDFLSDHLDYKPNSTEDLDREYLHLRSPSVKTESEHFLEQAAFSLDSNLFLNHEGTANDCAWIEKASSDVSSIPGIQNISYLSIVTSCAEKDPSLFDPIHGIESQVPDVSLNDCLMEMGEEENTFDPSLLTPSLSNASFSSEASDESIDKELDNLSSLPFIEELLKILHDEQGIPEYSKKLSSKEENLLIPKVSTRIYELALCLPPVWSSNWYETDLQHNYTPNAISNCDIKMEHDSILSLDEFIDVDHN
jgi:hypothetical protein